METKRGMRLREGTVGRGDVDAFLFGQVVHHVISSTSTTPVGPPCLAENRDTCPPPSPSAPKARIGEKGGKSQGDKRGLRPVCLLVPSEGGWREGGLLRDFSKNDSRGSNWTPQVNSPVASAWRFCASVLRTNPDRKIFFSSTFSTLVSTRTTEPSGMGLEGEGWACQGSG